MQTRCDMTQCFVVRPAGSSHEFLQLRRSPGEYMEGLWHTVAGRIEIGETAWQAALRELKEETGLDATEFYRLDGTASFYTDADDTLWHCPLFCALVSANSQVQLNEEHDAHRWISANDAANRFTWPSDRAWVKQICQEILASGPAKERMRISRP